MAPMQEAVTTVTEPVGDFFSGLAHLPSLADENERLEGRTTRLTLADRRPTRYRAGASTRSCSTCSSCEQTLDPTVGAGAS